MAPTNHANFLRTTFKKFDTKYYARGRKNFPAKKLIYIYIYISPPTYHLAYQMALLLLAHSGSWWARTAEPWVAEPSPYPVEHEVLIERIILIL